jgi:hypothetical protein
MKGGNGEGKRGLDCETVAYHEQLGYCWYEDDYAAATVGGLNDAADAVPVGLVGPVAAAAVVVVAAALVVDDVDAGMAAVLSSVMSIYFCS